MEWFKKHTDTIIILSGILSSVIWMNGKFGALEKDIANLDKDIAIVKTVLIMKNIMPVELAVSSKDDSI